VAGKNRGFGPRIITGGYRSASKHSKAKNQNPATQTDIASQNHIVTQMKKVSECETLCVSPRGKLVKNIGFRK
jgi:hypothetical protein